MKRANREKIVQMHEHYKFKNSPQALTLESEIKRIAAEREESIEQTTTILAEMSGVSTKQIYNYRNGVTDIPSGLIPVFCRQFGSNALAKAILTQCDETEELESFDIVRLANQSAQEVLSAHSKFLQVFDDGKVDGFERNEIKRKTASAVAWFHRLEQIVDDAYNRRQAA